MPPHTTPRDRPAPPGATEAERTLGLVLLAWGVMAFQECFLFLRQSPYGTPYVDRISRFFPAAVLWNLWAALLPAVPFLLWWLWRWDRVPTRARAAQFTLLGLLLLATGLDHADHELMRFMGLHLSWSVVKTYGNVNAWSAEMWQLFRRDRGGADLSFVILGLSLSLMLWGGRRLLRRPPPGRLRTRAQLAAVVLGAMALLGASRIVWPDGNRWRRVKPALVGLFGETKRRLTWGSRPADYTALAADWRQRWLAESSDSAWAFPDTAYPLYRVPAGPPAPTQPAVPPNIIYIQLETFRGWDVGFLRPDRPFTPTPFLDSLAADPGAAAYLRFLSFGPETVNGLFAGQCSVKPHRRESPTAMFTTTRFRCLPEVLRDRGYRTEFMTGVDPDWDFQTFWLRRWFDTLDVPHRSEEADRPVFRRAAREAKTLGAAGRPFYLMVVSFTNHLPFRSREPALDLVHSTRPDSAIWNTMHYTDDVLREFFAAIRDEPWFSHTVVVITGDHGENLGEHDGTAAQRNGWRETVWVPLLLLGSDPRLPRGQRTDVAGLMDLAPTLAELAGIREPTSWMGHSLLRPEPAGRTVSGYRKSAAFTERGPWSLVLDPNTGQLRLYHALQDPLQRTDVAPSYPDTAAALSLPLRWDQALVDYLLEADRVWPGAAGRDSFPQPR